MIRLLYRTADGKLRDDLTERDIATALRDEQGLLWVDLIEEPAETCAPLLLETFGFHPLAVDDALEERHVPKVDDWTSYLYVVLHAVAFDPHADRLIDTLELDIFLGKNYLVTYQARRIAAVERVWTAFRRDRRLLEREGEYLLYRLADELVTDYMPVIDQIDDEIDDVEAWIFDHPHATVLEDILSLKRALLQLRRILTPQREVLNRLARDEYAVVRSRYRVYFRDVYDHLVRLYDLNESMRELVTGVLETHLSVVNNRMNDIMKTLTVITTLFMPLSFVAGFFGMNFFGPTVVMAAWTSRTALALTLLAMALMPLGMALWMRRRGWL